MKKKITSPFFVINPKDFLYGDSLMELAHDANKLAKYYDIDILFTAPLTELANVVRECPYLIVTALHMDDIQPGNTIGRVLPESLVHIGVQAVVLNHTDRSLTLSTLAKSVHRAREVGIQTIVCADSIWESQVVAMLQPDVVLAEPAELIGKKQTSNHDYVKSTIENIKKINTDILVEQGAGIRSEKDVTELLQLGADGVGVTSGIIKNENPTHMMKKMIQAVAAFKIK